MRGSSIWGWSSSFPLSLLYERSTTSDERSRAPQLGPSMRPSSCVRCMGCVSSAIPSPSVIVPANRYVTPRQGPLSSSPAPSHESARGLRSESVEGAGSPPPPPHPGSGWSHSRCHQYILLARLDRVERTLRDLRLLVAAFRSAAAFVAYVRLNGFPVTYDLTWYLPFFNLFTGIISPPYFLNSITTIATITIVLNTLSSIIISHPRRL